MSAATGRRLVLVRHGRTSWNALPRIQGQQDSPLDDVGQAQARAVAPLVAELKPVLLWTSDLSRARHTAEAIAEVTGLTPVRDPRLREFGLGSYEGLTHTELAERDPEGFQRFLRGEWDGIPGAEAPADVARRHAHALRDLAAALAPGETGVAVSHGSATRAGLVSFLGWPLQVARDLVPLGNCARVLLVEREDGGWSLASYNL
ncbi:histidine phosphatase family protein [Nocardioides sp. zg-536]|uniref:Histidine phosphatase family protein n=1 Tax=Nocardioides faecalis TaxID=2803858 RepID=A0A939BYV2_9ACTN|nr:histidine phosphatase family protein [Nocardioides faecalis]MBM9460360.1 histidine phosphatase family protein [Nocardioides faecalis]QVI59812.1 histidine phosphatase family protein [Nocardioides faecalis]